MLIPFEPQYLPGYGPNGKRPPRKRRCRYRKGTKKKAKWRKLLRKWKRRKKRRAKRRRRKALKSTSSTVTRSKASTARKAKRDKRKKRKKRIKLHKKRVRIRKHRLRRHLQASRTRKRVIKAKKGKLTRAEILARIAFLKEQRHEMMLDFHHYRALNCSAKRKAIRHLRNAWKRQRHQRKKYKRYRKMLQRKAKKMDLKIWRNKQLPRPTKYPNVQTNPQIVKKPEKEPPRAIYENDGHIKVPLYAIEMPCNDVHLKEKEKIMVDGLPLYCKTAVQGAYGRVPTRILHGIEEHMIVVDIWFTAQLTHDNTGCKEAKILSKLAMIESRNTLRIIQTGQYLNIQYVLTDTCLMPLDVILEDHKNMDPSVCAHIIQQTHNCVRDLHKIGYSHLRISPSAFSIKKNDTRTFVFNTFHHADTRQNIRGKSPRTETLEEKIKWFQANLSDKRRPKRNPVEPYMSRGQHFRIVKGTSDDYESWFYVCARIFNRKPLAWEKETEHMPMAVAKYNFAKEYSHPDSFINMKMKTLQKYCLSSNNRDTKKTAYFVERIIQDWVDRKPFKGLLPWQDKEKEDDKKEEQKEWEKKNKWWKAPKEKTIIY